MITEIENAILTRLKQAGTAGVLGYEFKSTESYPADWDVYLKEDVINLPAAWVVFGGWSPVEDFGDQVTVRATFGLVVAAQNLRNETATRHGTTAANGRKEVGSYQLALDAVGLLQGNRLGLGITALKTGTLRFVRPTQAMLERKMSMLAVQFQTDFTLGTAADPQLDDLGDFATFSAIWDVQPFGTANAPSPDFSDLLTLPIQEPTP